MTAVAIIPARGGSRRIKHKNISLFHGKPIICYSIECARAAGVFDDIVVTTDDNVIGNVAAEAGATVIWRDSQYAVDSVGTQEVVRQTLKLLPDYGYTCCIYATAPLMLSQDLVHGWQRIQEEAVPYVYTVCTKWIDAGQWYWGKTSAFRAGVPLDQAAYYVLPNIRVCDINTPDDWRRAEILYEKLHADQDT